MASSFSLSRVCGAAAAAAGKKEVMWRRTRTAEPARGYYIRSSRSVGVVTSKAERRSNKQAAKLDGIGMRINW